MSANTAILEYREPIMPDKDYDHYDGFDAYTILTMPMYTYEAGSVADSRNKEIVYL